MSQGPTTTGRDRNAARLSMNGGNRLLASKRRRIVLDTFMSLEGLIDLDNLAAIIAERESDNLVQNERNKASVPITLHHVHLPKLEDFGVIDYDPETKRVLPYS